MTMIGRDQVLRQYASEDNLQTRMSVWHPTADGREPTCEALDAVLAAAPTSVLEVGCGTGAFAARVAAALPDAQPPEFVLGKTGIGRRARKRPPRLLARHALLGPPATKGLTFGIFGCHCGCKSGKCVRRFHGHIRTKS